MQMSSLSVMMMIVSIHIILKNTLTGRINIKAVMATACVLFLSFGLSIFLFPGSIVQDIIYVVGILFTLFTPVLTIRGVRKQQSIYFAALILGLVTTVITLLWWIVCIIVTTGVTISLIDLFINSIMLFICMLPITRIKFVQIFRNITFLRTYMKVVLLISTWLSALLASLFSDFFRVYADLPGLPLTGVLTAVVIILVGIMCPLLIMNNLSSTYYKNLSVVMDKQVQAQVAHYETMSKVNKDIRNFRHDYKNLRVGLVDFLKRNDVASAMTLLQSDEMLPQESIDSFETGSVVLDALLNEKQSTAVATGASIEFEGVVPGNLLKPADVCVIFGNALDNAIEACTKCSGEGKKVITVRSAYANGLLFIKIENPVTADVRIINNTVATTKENTEAHGIGLQSMRTSVEKYSGDMKLSCEGGVFCVEIDLDFNSLEIT